MNKKIILKGSLWTSASTITTAFIQIIRLSILAHFLEKGDFGVVAILTMILGFTNTFSELGFSTIVMHKQNITDREFSSLYWAQLLLYIAIYVIISSISPFVARFFNEPSITYLLPIAMLDLILYGVGRLYETVIQKEFKFNVLAKRSIIASLISLVVAVVLAYKGAGVFSLIISTLAQTIILNVWNLLQGMKSMPLRLYCSFKLIKPLFGMGINMTGAHMLDYMSTKIDVFIIGKMLGTETLGIYNLAKELIMKGVMLVNSIVNRVGLPLFAREQNDIISLKNNYCKLIKIISLINFPICTTIGVLGCVIVPIIYGETYLDVVPVLFVLSIWGCVSCIGNPVGNVIIATGRTDISFKYALIRLLCYIPCVYVVSTYNNIMLLSWGITILTVFSTFLSWYMQVYKTIHLNIIQFANSFIKPLLLSLIVGSVGYIILETLAQSEKSFSMITLCGMIWCLCYFSILIVIENKTVLSIKSFLKK